MSGLSPVSGATARHVGSFHSPAVVQVSATLPSSSSLLLQCRRIASQYHQCGSRYIPGQRGFCRRLDSGFYKERSGILRKQRGSALTCSAALTATAAVVEQEVEEKANLPKSAVSSSIPPLNVVEPSLSSSSASNLGLASPERFVRPPSPQAVAPPRAPFTKTYPKPATVNHSPHLNKKWTPTSSTKKPSGIDNDSGVATFKQSFRPRDKSSNPDRVSLESRSSSEGKTSSPIKRSVDILGDILGKAERLQEQNLQNDKERVKEKEKSFTRSTWRKGVGLETPPPSNAPQTSGHSPNATSRTGSVRKNSEMNFSSRAPPQSDVKKPEMQVAESSFALRTQESAQVLRKPVILKDVGARDQSLVKRTSSPGMTQSPSKLGGGKTSTRDVLPGPPKPGAKLGLPKGKDNKEDWKKKSDSLEEGMKRKIGGVKVKNGDDIVGDVCRGGARKMSKASRKAARVEAARASAPVKVDILEVGKEGISIPDLAQQLAVNDAEIVKTLFMKGIATTVNQTLDEETVKLVCEAFDVEVVEAGSRKLEDMAKKTEFLDEDDLDNLEVRPPVVTIMGHVDHGKTSLLDFIRKSKIAAGEAGGITQGIGAYTVPVTVAEQVQSCVFLDTPGHQAFTAMRARGARVTDIAVIVVAADDGVRPQTQEAISHAKAANVPIIVAINKIDKDGAQPDRVMQELSGIGLLPEDWGGDVPMIQISALKGQNVELLLETVMLLAELQELKANPSRTAKGTVIESCLDKTKGVLATLLVQNGTLRKGDVVLCGEAYGKVRALLDHTGVRVDKAGPSTAVQVFGLSTVPVAGEEFEVLDSLEVARERAEQCGQDARLTRLAARAAEGKVTLASLATSVVQGTDAGVERHQMNVILKVDVQGTLEAIREALKVLPQDTVNLRMLMQAVGDVTISDVDLAIASEGVIIGFNTIASSTVQSYADEKGVEIRLYRVIYELIDDIRNAMEGLLDVAQDQVAIGTAEVRAIFNSGSGKVAGCMVTDGKLVKGCGCKIIRAGEIVHTDNLFSLRRVKELAKEVVAGLECGVGLENYNEWQEGDIIEAFNLVAKKRTLEEASIDTASSLELVALKSR